MAHGKRIALALSLVALVSVASPAWSTGVDATPGARHQEECTPTRVVSGLRQQVKFWAREGSPVALAAQISDTTDAPASSVAWRLLITTIDREVVDERHGVSPLREGEGFASVAFDGRDATGHPLAAGHYAYRFEIEGFEGSGGLLDVYASDEVPPAEVADVREPLASSLNPSVPYNFYFGAQHAHTAYSDGGIPLGGASCASVSSPHAGAKPADAFAYAKSKGMVDWICVIEHNHLLDDACSGCSTATLQGEYHDGINAAAAATTSTFVGIYGMEWGVIGDSTTHTGHVALYDVTKLFGWETYAEVSTGKNDYLGLWTATANAANAGASGAVASLCHAHTYDFQSWAKNTDGQNVVRGVAVISGPYDQKGETFADGGGRYAGPSVGTDLYQYALQRGWTVGPESHADNHCANYGTSTRNRTVVLANSLSKASVIGALKARHFYASSDLNAQLFFGTSDYAHTMGDIFTTSASTANLLLWVNDPDGATVSTVTLYQGNPAAGSGSPTTLSMTSQGNGTYTATVNVTTSQAYWYAYATLSNGAEMWSSPVWITKTSGCSDTTAPTATITAPSASTVTGTVTVTATGADNIGVTSMTLKIDGATVATSASGSVSYSWNTSGLTAGSSHTITATASDACGNVSSVATKTVTIGSTCSDSTAPTATITAPSASSVSGTVSVSATGADNIGVTSMTLKIDGATVATSASGSVSYSWNTSGLTAGSSHTITATASDACGNVSATASKTVTIATSNPFVDPTVNGNFEAGVPPTGWTESGTYEQISGTGTAIDNASVSPHAGTRMAWMAGYDNANDILKQNVTIPNVSGSVNLGFWRQVHTTDGTGTAYDFLYVEVWNSAGTSKLSTLQTLSNRNAGGTWIHNTGLVLDTWKGQTVQIRFTATNDTSNPTDFFIDDVTITNP